MEQSAILGPILGMIGLTFVVWFTMYKRRIKAMYKEGKPADYYKRPDSISILPDDVNYPADNFKNLFEVPILFYVVCFALWMAGMVDTIYIYLAWGYVAARALHSYIQCGSNKIMMRFRVYTLSCLILFAMYIKMTWSFLF